MNDEEHSFHYDGPSRSSQKRDAEALQALGEQLVGLSAERLAQVPIPDALRDAIEEAQHIKSRPAHKRQLQFIGRLMREVDPAPIREALDRLTTHGAAAAAALHRIERWRDRLLAEGDEALSDLADEYPEVDRHHIRQLVRNAHKELRENRPHHSARALFRYLRELLEG